MALRLGIIKLIACPIGDVLTPLHCHKVSVATVIKLLRGKYVRPQYLSMSVLVDR
jgi:hypothetical protein